MADQTEQAEMDALLAQLDEWADGEGDLPIIDDSKGDLTPEQKRSLWSLLNQPATTKNTLSRSGAALR